MKFLSHSSLIRPALSLFNHRPCSSLHTSFFITNEVITILGTVSPVEPSLEELAPYLSRSTITSVLKETSNPQLGFSFFIWAMQQKRFRSWDSHNFVIDMLLKDNGFPLFWQTLEDLNRRGAIITSHAFSVLIAAYWKMGLAEKAVEAFGKMNEFDCKPDTFTYNSIIYVVLQKQVFFLGLALYSQMLKLNCTPNRATFNILIDGLCKCGKTEEALRMFDEMTQRGILPNTMTYTIVLAGLCRAAKTDDAISLFGVMKSGKFEDMISYNSLLDGLCKVGRVDDAVELLLSMKNMGLVLGINGYSCVIHGLFKAGRFDDAQFWYSKVLEEGIQPDLILYTIVIGGLASVGKMDEAFKILAEMTAKGITPDTYCYNALIKGFCDVGLLDTARSLQLEISTSDSFPDSCTYTILISGMCRNGLVKEARDIFDEMEKSGCIPSVVTFNSLIHGHCKTKEVEEAHLLFYKMEIGRNPSLFLRLSQGAERVLDRASLQSMVEKLCESGRILKAYKLLIQLANSGVVPDITTYNILINGLCKAKNIKGAFKLFKDLQLKGHTPDAVTYGTLIDGLQRVDKEDDAFVIFEQMIKNGCTPSSAVYKSLMTWSCRRKKVSLAFTLWLEYLRSLPRYKDEDTNLLEEDFKNGQIEKAIQQLIEIDLKSKAFDASPYCIILVGLIQASKKEEASKLFSVLVKNKIEVSPPSCVSLIECLCREGNLDLAVEVFLYTLDKGVLLMPRICNLLIRFLLRTQDKADDAIELLCRMRSIGYDLDAHLHHQTKDLVDSYWNTREIRKVSPG